MQSRTFMKWFLRITCSVIPLLVLFAPVSFDGVSVAHATTVQEISVNTITAGLKLFANGGSLLDALASIVSTIFLKLAAFLLWFAGVFLNFMVLVNVVYFGEWMSNVAGIQIAWEVIRDLANMGFIFTLIYMSISMILRLESYTARKMLAKVVIAALLINFSLFFTRVVIDFSNIVANEFYQGIVSINGDFDAQGNDQANSRVRQLLNNGVSGAFVQNIKLMSLFDVDVSLDNDDTGLGNTFNVLESPFKIIIAGIAGIIFILVLAFVFFAGGILLLLRIISLVILMITSPIAVVASVLPNTSRYSKKWVQDLIQNAFFAPVYMAILFVVVLIIQNESFKQGINQAIAGRPVVSDSFASFFVAGNVSMFPLIINYAIVVGLALAAIIYAKRIGIRGGETMVKWGTNAREWTQGFVGRNTIGFAANRIANSDVIKGNLQSNNVAARIGSRLVLNTSEKIESQSFGGAKGGFKKSLEARTKADERYTKLQAETGRTSEAQETKKEEVRGAEQEFRAARDRVRQAEQEVRAAKRSGDQSALSSAQSRLANEQKDVVAAEELVREAWSKPIDGGMQAARASASAAEEQMSSFAEQLTVPQMQVAQKLYEIEKELASLQSKTNPSADDQKKIAALQAKQAATLRDVTSDAQRQYSTARITHDNAVDKVGKIEKATKQLIAEQKISNYSVIPQIRLAEQDAVKKIRKEASKSKDSKLLDDIKKLAKESSDSGSDEQPSTDKGSGDNQKQQ